MLTSPRHASPRPRLECISLLNLSAPAEKEVPDKAADERKGNGKKLSFCLKIAEAEGMRGYRKFVRKYVTAAGKPREMI